MQASTISQNYTGLYAFRAERSKQMKANNDSHFGRRKTLLIFLLGYFVLMALTVFSFL
jgi:hypothetical protein